ncbi:MAG TPA: 5-(carboxyamino)imidazole ribonucleotide synthase [Lactobacillaceae bacterium]|jgi:5-(carboxyamino)imidazole ribonucleotide synthase
MTNVILPPATIGIVGGGQLGRMITLAAKPMGYRVGVLDPAENSPAGQVADFQIIAPYDDAAALEKLATESDVITYEFENVDRVALATVEHLTLLPQGLLLLEITSNRLREKTFIREQGVSVTDFAEVTSVETFGKAVETVGLPAILKTVSGGYDGHGQWDVNSADDVAQLSAHWPGDASSVFILEKRIVFEREVSVMVTRDGADQVHFWPVAENVHADHILKTSYAPARLNADLQAQIADIATKIANGLQLRGVLGVEMFVTADNVYVNELAPRPHNSGHYTIEATNVSQFEGHVRSITGLPIPKITQEQPALMLNLLGDDLQAAREALVAQSDWHFHDYGKVKMKPGRKMGHITVLGETAIENLQKWSTQHG